MTRAQSDALLTVLREIKDVLGRLAPPLVEEIDEDGGCLHPEDQRISFATMQDPQHWICRVCKYEHHGVEDDAQATL